MVKRVILVGGSHEIIELCDLCRVEVVGIIEKASSDFLSGYTVFGGDEQAPEIFRNYGNIPLVITPDLPSARKKLATYYEKHGFCFATLISPRALVSPSARIGSGVIIQSGVNVSAHVTVGNFVRLNSCSNVMHDSVVSDYSTIAPNAVILGRVRISQGVYVGANATVLPDKVVGEGSVVGAASVVTRDVPEKATVMGNPAKESTARI